jgi:hypothetical protein
MYLRQPWPDSAQTRIVGTATARQNPVRFIAGRPKHAACLVGALVRGCNRGKSAEAKPGVICLHATQSSGPSSDLGTKVSCGCAGVRPKSSVAQQRWSHKHPRGLGARSLRTRNGVAWRAGEHRGHERGPGTSRSCSAGRRSAARALLRPPSRSESDRA